MSFVVEDPGRHSGRAVANGHCVRYVQEAGGVPHSSRWRRGEKVRGSGAAPGTVIATFDPNGLYGNHTDGSSHAAVLIAEEDTGLRVWDQWVGHPVSQRVIRFRGGQGRKVNDGDQFHIVETEDTAVT
jgi:hypothetical protein